MNKPEPNRSGPVDGWTAKYPELGTDPISIQANIDPNYFEQEREKIWKRSWLNVGREEDLPNPGDYVVRDVEILQTSVIIVRGEDDVIRAFHNVCQHRGNRVVIDRSGNAKGFKCGFHGWTYGLDGELGYVPDEDQFFNLDKCKSGLRPIATELWRGFIFINTNPKQNLKNYLGEIGEQLDPFQFEDYQWVVQFSVDVKCNWKIFVDAFQEAYHVCELHRGSAYEPFAGKDNPFAHATHMQLWELHRMLSVPGNPEFVPSPSCLKAIQYGGNAVYTPAEGGSDSAASPPGTNPGKHPNWSFDIDVIFPNLQLLFGAGWYLCYNYWPISVDRTRWTARYYVPPPRTVAERIMHENTEAQVRDVVREDLFTLENTQVILNSGAITHMPLSDQELLVRHQYHVVEKLVRGE
ncbi:MAG: aromatic ring-hydroxylating dioxygenase subunit alpha [Gammaproteobacteria bacterium]|nr:aromatic ring-hydroxylating dioxygenase subunit alpha [Gammaproteobacteria bacterium]